MNPLLYNYNTLSQFHRIENEGIITIDNLSEKISVHIKKVTFADGGEDEDYNLWAWEFVKDGETYLLPMKRRENRRIVQLKLEEQLPFRIKGEPQLIANNGKVYKLVENYEVVKYLPEKLLSFKSVTDSIGSIPHENKTHKTLFTILCLGAYIDNINFRVSTPPGFGKDSTVDIIGMLMGDSATVENPTLAKFEREISINKLVALNEIVKIPKADWDQIQLILLASAAQKPSIKKRSRKFGGVSEDIDLTELSICLMYNDIECYDKPQKYFDFVTDANVIDRFPPLRLFGRISYDFTRDDNKSFNSIALENQEFLRSVIKSLLYYKHNWDREIHHYDTSKLSAMPHRWKLNMMRFIRYLDLYCESQEEFDSYLVAINASMLDYKAMLAYPSLLKALEDKSQKEAAAIKQRFIKSKIKSYSEKIKMLDLAIKGEDPDSVNNKVLQDW